MSDTNSNKAGETPPPTTLVNPFSNQATGLLETTFAETLGLSMHNAVSNQQSSQMTTSASVTNACARLLQAPVVIRQTAKKNKNEMEKQTESNLESASQPKTRGLLNSLLRTFKRDKKNDPETSGEKQ